jgi:cytoskeleton protein RodZ
VVVSLTVNEGDQNAQETAQIGALLERKRREKGLSLKEAEQATKIRTRYLEGLEREDYSMLPDAVYVHGFLKTYANFLGLDGERLSRELREHRAPSRRSQFVGHDERRASRAGEESEMPPMTLLGGVERRRILAATVLTVALAVLVLATVIGVLYFIGRGSQAPVQPVDVEPDSKSAQEEEQPAKEPAVQETTAPIVETTTRAVRATVKVVESSPTGLTVYTDGTVADSRIAQPGFSRSFEARDAVTVSAANAGAVEVEVNGRNIGRLGSSGQGATRTFTQNS